MPRTTAGIAHTAAGQIAEAVGDFDKAIALKPDFAAAYNNRGIAYMKAGRLAEAIRDYSRAIELQPGYADAFENRASAFSQNGQYEQALADVQTFRRRAAGRRPCSSKVCCGPQGVRNRKWNETRNGIQQPGAARQALWTVAGLRGDSGRRDRGLVEQLQRSFHL